MPRIIKTKGICLCSRPIRETSKSVIFYTEIYGKLSFICKGARTLKSKFGAAVEIFALSDLMFYATESRPFYVLSDATLINSFPTLNEMTKFLCANQIVEIILRAVNYEDANRKLFHLLYIALKNLDQHLNNSTQYKVLLGGYFLKAISLLGFKPELSHCVICQKPSPQYFSITRGGVICEAINHPKPSDCFGQEHIKVIKYLLNNPLQKSFRLTIQESTLHLIKNYLKFYLEKNHINSLDVSNIFYNSII